MPSKSESMLPVLIVHWNRSAECHATIGEFQGQGIPVSIRVVDNGSKSECVEALKKGLPAEVKLVELSENKGWGGGLNVLLRDWLAAEDAKFCIVSAHDALLMPDCVKLLVAAMERDSRLGIACPQYECPAVIAYSPIGGVEPTMGKVLPTGEVTPVDAAHGLVMIFRRECIAEIGVFDERYFAYGDEAEIGLRARKCGWKVGIVWGAIVENPGTATPNPVVGYLSARNSLLMARDYGGLCKALIRALLMFVNTLRLLYVRKAWNSMSSPRARFLAIRDFLRARYGPPPRSLQTVSSKEKLEEP